MDGSIDTQEHLEQVALDRIGPSPTNPRKRFDPTKLQELADSIAAKGLISPVVLPPLSGTRFELVVGERRYRASKLAGLNTILALVRTLTDREVCELQLEENGQREDVHPLEEADAYQHLQRQGAALEELAARTGKSTSYVRQRLQYCALGTEGRAAFLDGKLTPATALLIARIPGPKLQADAVKELTRPDYQGEVMGARQAGDHIRGRYMLQLAAAPARGEHASAPHALDVRATTGSPNVACLVLTDGNGTRCYPRMKARTDEAWRMEVRQYVAGAMQLEVARLYSQKGVCLWDSRDGGQA